MTRRTLTQDTILIKTSTADGRNGGNCGDKARDREQDIIFYGKNERDGEFPPMFLCVWDFMADARITEFLQNLPTDKKRRILQNEPLPSRRWPENISSGLRELSVSSEIAETFP